MNQQNAKSKKSDQCCSDAEQDAMQSSESGHPVAAGLGAVGGATVGAVAGSLAGPVGTVAGAAIGAVAGGMAGSATAAALDPAVETRYWKENHASRPYANDKFGYDEYAPAYRYGWESFGRDGSSGKTFDSVEADLGRGWDKAKGNSRLGWDQAKSASKNAWQRLESGAKGAPNGKPANGCNA